MPRLTLNYCSIVDVERIEPKADDEQRKARKVIINVDEEDFFKMLDGINPKNIIKYLDMRGIQHRDPSVINVKVKPTKSGFRIRNKLKRIGNEYRNITGKPKPL